MIGRNRLTSLAVTLLLLLCCAATARGASPGRCAGGGQPRPDEGGIGGTGLRPAAPVEDDGGIGGTGISAAADTGIIGTITGFASICVGEVEIHYDDATSVRIDGEPATAAQLAVGQVVEVVAGTSGSELTARSIAVHHVVAGPVSRIDSERGELEVMGQTVRVSAATGGGGQAAAADFPPGTFVQVSGMRAADGIVVASRVTRGETPIARLEGPLASAPTGELRIAGTPVGAGGDIRLSAGAEVRVAGRWDGSRLVASSVEAIPRVPFGGHLARIEVEGYPTLSPGRGLRVGPFLFELPSSTAAGTLSRLGRNAPVRVRAAIRNRRAVVEQVDPAPARPPRPAARPDGMHERNDGPAGGSAMEGPPHDAPEEPGSRDIDVPRPAPPDAPAAGAPPRPARPDRAAPPPIARPPHIDRPPPLPRALIPERPPRPPRPGRI